MPTEKLTRILLAKSSFSPQQISVMTDAEGWRWVYANKAPVKGKHFEICFTGFSDADKASVCRLAITAGLSVVTTVTRNLSMLCVGPNPGPAKLENASKQGVCVVTLGQFKQFLETGEIPA
ncbi:MAG: BRCT domain-containing protein [Candidatus Acidiferrales bacterium]